MLNDTELRAWRCFKRNLCLANSFVAKPGHLCFSWDNKRRHRHNLLVQNSPILGKHVIRWIDHIYHFISSHTCPFSMTSTILPGFCLLDHALILTTLQTNGIVILPSLYRVNSSHLKDKELHDQLTSLWEGIKLEMLKDEIEDGRKVENRLFKGLYESKKIMRAYSKEKSRKGREKEHAL